MADDPTKSRPTTIAPRDLRRLVVLTDHVSNAAPPETYPRPSVRADCLEGGVNAARPCPFVSCRFHLYLEVDPRRGALKINFPLAGEGFEELRETCALDVADRGEHTLEEIGQLLGGLSRERIRQISDVAEKFYRDFFTE